MRRQLDVAESIGGDIFMPGTKPGKNLGGAEQKFYNNLTLLLPLVNID